MISEPAIDKQALLEALYSFYSLNLDNLVFISRGETSWVYSCDSNQERFFLKILDLSNDQKTLIKLMTSLSLTSELHKLGITNISCPLSTQMGNLFIKFSKYHLILYPFIQGKILDSNLNEALPSLFKTIAKVHSVTNRIDTKLQVEDFDISYSLRIVSLVNQLGSMSSSELISDLKELLLPYKEKIVQDLEALLNLKDRINSSEIKSVVCHSDLIGDNLFVTEENETYILDWDGAYLAPKELDVRFLMNFDNFQDLYDEYQSMVGKTELDLNILCFYAYRRYIDDLVDWLERILFEDVSLEQKRQDLEGIKSVSISDMLGISERIERMERLVQLVNAN